MNLYRFSPITTPERLREAVVYIATQTSLLCKNAVGQELPIASLTVFAHYPQEYALLEKILYEMGDAYNENNGPRVRLHTPIVVGKHRIEYLRIRKPDPYRMQVGCNDFQADYGPFKREFLDARPQHLRLIERPEYEMIEFFDPDFDVLAYVVSAPTKC